MASISRCFCSQSKKPPQVAGALLDVLDVIEGLGGGHGKEFTVGADRQVARGNSVAELVGVTES
jgi:hypothetical protein